MTIQWFDTHMRAVLIFIALWLCWTALPSATHAADPITVREILEEPSRILRPLATEVETEDAKRLDADKMHRWERALMRTSGAIADRYFLQGATAVPTVKLVGLA